MMELRAVNGARLREARKARGLSRDTLAYEIRTRAMRLGWDVRTNARRVAAWEDGSQPHPHVVPLIADVLGVSVLWLHGESDSQDEDAFLENWASLGEDLLRRAGRSSAPVQDGPTRNRDSAERARIERS